MPIAHCRPRVRWSSIWTPTLQSPRSPRRLAARSRKSHFSIACWSRSSSLTIRPPAAAACATSFSTRTRCARENSPSVSRRPHAASVTRCAFVCSGAAEALDRAERRASSSSASCPPLPKMESPSSQLPSAPTTSARHAEHSARLSSSSAVPHERASRVHGLALRYVTATATPPPRTRCALQVARSSWATRGSRRTARAEPLNISSSSRRSFSTPTR